MPRDTVGGTQCSSLLFWCIFCHYFNGVFTQVSHQVSHQMSHQVSHQVSHFTQSESSIIWQMPSPDRLLRDSKKSNDLNNQPHFGGLACVKRDFLQACKQGAPGRGSWTVRQGERRGNVTKWWKWRRKGKPKEKKRKLSYEEKKKKKWPKKVSNSLLDSKWCTTYTMDVLRGWICWSGRKHVGKRSKYAKIVKIGP